MATVACLYQTRDLYREYLDINSPLTFSEWNKLDRNKKSAALYLQFFNEIVLAWDKANTLDFIDCEEGVEIVNQYLEKNVPIIENNPNRFSPRYIYKVAYNCMYCICHDRKGDKDRMEFETPQIINKDGEEFDLTSLVPGGRGADEDYEEASFEKEFWAVIEDSGLEAEKVMRYLLTNNESDLNKLSKHNKHYVTDPLRDVEVSLNEAQDIISKLREKFRNVSANSLLGQKLLSMNLSLI